MMPDQNPSAIKCSDTLDCPEHPPKVWRIWGLGAMVAWFFLFASGVLIDSADSRKALGWKASQEATKFDALHQEIRELKAKISQPEGNLAGTAQDTLQEINKMRVQIKDLFSKLNDTGPSNRSDKFIVNFLIAFTSFMPLNVGLLCVLAAFIGGCSVDKEKIYQLRSQLDNLPTQGADQDRMSINRQITFLSEHPSYSAIRGLVVYLILISGLIIMGPSSFSKSSEPQELFNEYLKFAGIASFFGYLAGYDPTLFSSLINLGSSRIRPKQGENVNSPEASGKTVALDVKAP